MANTPLTRHHFVYKLSGRGLKSMAVITLVETELVYSNKQLKEELFHKKELLIGLVIYSLCLQPYLIPDGWNKTIS